MRASLRSHIQSAKILGTNRVLKRAGWQYQEGVEMTIRIFFRFADRGFFAARALLPSWRQTFFSLANFCATTHELRRPGLHGLVRLSRGLASALASIEILVSCVFVTHAQAATTFYVNPMWGPTLTGFASEPLACSAGATAFVAAVNGGAIPPIHYSLAGSVWNGMCTVTFIQYYSGGSGTHFVYLSVGVDAPPARDTNTPMQAGMCFGNPILPATGEKVLSQTDHEGEGPDALGLVRSYRSSRVTDAATGPASAGLGQPWSHNHLVALKRSGTAGAVNSMARIMFGDGNIRAFSWDVTTSWKATNGADTLVSNGAGLLYKRLDDDTSWQFDTAGKLLTMTRRNGRVTAYTYSGAGTPTTIAPTAGLLIKVSNAFGHSLNFVYNAAGQLASVTMPDGQVTSYGYDSTTVAGRLATVSYPAVGGGTVSKTYLYENAGFPQLLTGIIDEKGVRYETLTYDSQGRGTSTQLAGGADLYSISYATAGAAVVTDPLGTQRTYSYGTSKGTLAVLGADKPGGSGGSDAASRAQDANGFVTQETDFLGVNTMYTWDINRRLPLTTTRAAGLPEVQTTSTQWHASFRLPVLVTEAGRTTAYTYDTAGNPLTMTVTNTATGVARTTTWTYTAQGMPATETAPTSVLVRSYAYYPTTSFSGTAPYEVGNTAGDLQSITNAAGHITQFTLYDRAGRVRQMVDAKGVVTDTAYTPRGGVSSVTVTPPGGPARTTSYSYDNAGQLTGVAMPDATTMSYSYDAAHRLTGVTDAKGNSVTYTLDAMGNKTGEQVKDPSGNLQRNITRVYDALNRVQQVTGAGD
jgi:YD repeat-containing protein